MPQDKGDPNCALYLIFFFYQKDVLTKGRQICGYDQGNQCPSAATQIRISFHCWLNSYIGILHDLPAHQNSQRQRFQSQYKKYIP